jgi:hypothetical protein
MSLCEKTTCPIHNGNQFLSMLLKPKIINDVEALIGSSTILATCKHYSNGGRTMNNNLL